MHSIMDSTVRTFAGSIVEPTDVPTEDILPPILPPTEDIPPASDNILVRFTVGITRAIGLLIVARTSCTHDDSRSNCNGTHHRCSPRHHTVPDPAFATIRQHG